ncbi:MAG: hypothetical protein LUQ59_12685 [Methanothrix sp.]|nr:hypothetical protein [Methanothrix sp.]
MIPKDSDSFSDGEYENPGELTWSEFDWEKYLRKQDDVILRYLGFYESMAGSGQRIDDTARCMGWEGEPLVDPVDLNEDSAEDDESDDDLGEPYILQHNPVYIASTAIELGLQRSWERLAAQAGQVPQSLAVSFLAAMHRSETISLLAIQSLDFGDYTLAVSQFKRAMRELNTALSDLNSPLYPSTSVALAFRAEATSMLFDLREIWLRVMAECRDEVKRQTKRKNDSGSGH